MWSFIKHYAFKRGYRDGWAGFVIALGNFDALSIATPNVTRKLKAGFRRRASSYANLTNGQHHRGSMPRQPFILRDGRGANP